MKTNNQRRSTENSCKPSMMYLSIVASLLTGSSALISNEFVVSRPKFVGIRTGAEISTGNARRTRSRHSSMTELFYRQHQHREEGAVAHAIRTATQQTDSSDTVWWSSLFGSGNDQQEVVDDYLEFLDKRYQRLNEVDKKESQFNAFSWLKQGQNLSEDPRKDALYILGVADMASQKLLQKHKSKSKMISYVHSEKLREDAKKNFDSSPVITVPALENSHPAVSKMTTALCAVANAVQRRRELLLRWQSLYLRTLGAFLRRSLSIIPVAAQAVWRMGGGKMSIALTLAAGATLSIMLRPALKAALQTIRPMLESVTEI